MWSGVYNKRSATFHRDHADLVPERHNRCEGLQNQMTITRDDDVLGGEPRIDGTRIGVRHVATWVVDSGQSPAHVADQLDVPLADVYEALSHYYIHIDEMRALKADNEAAFKDVRGSTLKPIETAQ